MCWIVQVLHYSKPDMRFKCGDEPRMTAVYFAVAKLEGTQVRGLGRLQTPSNVSSGYDLVLVCNIITLSRHRNPRCSDEPVREALQPHAYRSSSRGRAPQGGR